MKSVGINNDLLFNLFSYSSLLQIITSLTVADRQSPWHEKKLPDMLPLASRLSHSPFTAGSRVRAPLGVPLGVLWLTPRYYFLFCNYGVLLTRDPSSPLHASLVLVVSTSAFQTESAGSSPVCCSTRKGNSTVDDRRKPTVFPAGGLKYQHIKGKASIRKWPITCVSFREFATKNNITQLSSLLGSSAKE